MALCSGKPSPLMDEVHIGILRTLALHEVGPSSEQHPGSCRATCIAQGPGRATGGRWLQAS